MGLAERLREARTAADMTLDELAFKAHVSKTYLWELENDHAGTKKPSAEILTKLANALSMTIAELLGRAMVRVNKSKIELSSSLIEFRDWMKKIGEPLAEEELRDLATMRFRGGQPKSREDWNDLYRTLKRTT